MKIDLGSGPKECWYRADEDGWLRFDKEPFEGVIRWRCPDPIPVPDRSVEVAFLGQLLVYLELDEQKALAAELDRVMKRDGIIKVHKYGVETTGLIAELKKYDWIVESAELTNIVPDEPLETYWFTIIYVERDPFG